MKLLSRRAPSPSLVDLLVQAVICGLGGWRLASLLVTEGGPFSVFGQLRERVGAGFEQRDTFLSGVFSCVWCCSVWTATALWLLGMMWSWTPGALTAAWAVAILASELTHVRPDPD